jgi:hypothetical protein
MKDKSEERGKSKGEELGEQRYDYMVDGDKGIAKLPCEVDIMGKIHLPKLVRQQLGILEGAEVRISLEVVRKYMKKGGV